MTNTGQGHKEPGSTGAAPTVLEDLTEEECALFAILTDPSGLDAAEFLWHEPENPDGCFRAWDFQVRWWRDQSPLQIDQSARAVGKSQSIKVRACAFPFVHPGQEMVITAPELVHLEPIVSKVEHQMYATRLYREMLVGGRSGVTHRPFQMNFQNGSRIIGRIPQKDGKGAKGLHPIWLELDEAQDYGHNGWVELTETLKRGVEGAVWRAHGVTRGVRDDFYKFTTDRPDNPWKIHRYPAMYRPNWTDEERQEKIKQYGSRDDPDYRRNVLGLHGDSTQPLFVLTRLMASADVDLTSDYNVDEYNLIKIKNETLSLMDQDILDVLQFPSRHHQYRGQDPSKRKAQYWVGMDIGMTRDPSEILVFVEYRTKPNDEYSKLKLLTRIQMVRVGVTDQTKAILSVVNFYKPKVFAMDRGGQGLPFVQQVVEYNEQPDLQPNWAHQFHLEDSLSRIKGYNFGEKIIVDFDPNIDIEFSDDPGKDAGMRRNTKEYGIDKLRELVDNKRLLLPWDEELLSEFQGGTVSAASGLDQYGRRRFSKGQDHTLDAATMMALGWAQYGIEEMLNRQVEQVPILDAFVSF